MVYVTLNELMIVEDLKFLIFIFKPYKLLYLSICLAYTRIISETHFIILNLPPFYTLEQGLLNQYKNITILVVMNFNVIYYSNSILLFIKYYVILLETTF